MQVLRIFFFFFFIYINFGFFYQNFICFIGNLIINLSIDNETSLLFDTLKKAFDNNHYYYLNFINEIFPSLTETSQAQDRMLKTGLIDLWIKMAVKLSDSDKFDMISLSEKQIGLKYLANCWIKYVYHIENSLKLDQRIIDLIKRGSRHVQRVVKYFCFMLFFDILDSFAT